MGTSCTRKTTGTVKENKKMGEYPGNYSWEKRVEMKLNAGVEVTKTPSGVKCRGIFSCEKENDGKMTEQREEPEPS